MLDVFENLKSGPSCGPEGCEPVAEKKELIVVHEYMHKDEDEIPTFIIDNDLIDEYYKNPGKIDYRLYEVEVESVLDPNTMTYTVMGFKLGKDVYVRKEDTSE